MHTIAVVFVLLSVWGEVDFLTPSGDVPRNYEIDPDEVDDGQLQCYSCNTFLGHSQCESLGDNEEAHSNFILKCQKPPADGILPTCLFRKDNDFARAFGHEDDDNVEYSMLVEECRSGEECREKPFIRHPLLRNLVHRPPLQIPSEVQSELLDSKRSGKGGYQATKCFKLNAKGVDGRGFTIRGCANNNVDGCLIGNYVDTDDFECHLCNEQLCNGVASPFFRSYVSVITFCEAIRLIFMFRK